MKIFDQWQQWQCQWYAFLTALAIMNPLIDSDKIVEELKKEPNMLTPRRAGEWFVSKWYIKWYETVKPIQIKALLNRWIPLITGSGCGDFSKVTKENGYSLVFDRNIALFPHKYVIAQYTNDYYMCVNSWGDQWGSKGCFYVERIDYKWLWIPYRLFI